CGDSQQPGAGQVGGAQQNGAADARRPTPMTTLGRPIGAVKSPKRLTAGEVFGLVNNRIAAQGRISDLPAPVRAEKGSSRMTVWPPAVTLRSGARRGHRCLPEAVAA